MLVIVYSLTIDEGSEGSEESDKEKNAIDWYILVVVFFVKSWNI
ncbi:hypothetical protein [Enterococcus faecium]|nr:hypothetical protein [Enterococcus faecium]GMS55383.1 hypothetical protein NUITMVRE36_23750 [Enterococcus raffinosus]